MTAKGKGGEDSTLAALPFPPTAQANYGPTEKAVEYGLETLPRGMNPLVKSLKGTVEIRFIAAEIVSYCSFIFLCTNPRIRSR